MFSGWSETAEAVLCGGLGGPILGVGLWINGGSDLASQVGTEISHSTLDLAQEALKFILLLGPPLVLRGLTRRILLLALLTWLSLLTLLTLLTVAISVWGLTLVLEILWRRVKALERICKAIARTKLTP